MWAVAYNLVLAAISCRLEYTLRFAVVMHAEAHVQSMLRRPAAVMEGKEGHTSDMPLAGDNEGSAIHSDIMYCDVRKVEHVSFASKCMIQETGGVEAKQQVGSRGRSVC